MSPDTNLLEVEEVFRDAGSSVYLIPKPKLTIVIGMPAWRSALDRLHVAAREPLRAGRHHRLTGSHHTRGRWPMRCHEMHFRRVRRNVDRAAMAE